MRRAKWIDLNGAWDFAFDPKAEICRPKDVVWNRTITVPFSPETPASGINDQGLYCVVWYRRSFQRPELKPGERLMLHFGAVDYGATVWVNGVKAIEHEGGYTPFQIEIQELLVNGPEQQIVVRAEDDPGDLEKPRGKQDWKLEPHSIWYPRTTGIWQDRLAGDVLPAAGIGWGRCNGQSSLKHWDIGLDARVHRPDGALPDVGIRVGGRRDHHAMPAVEAECAGCSDRYEIR